MREWFIAALTPWTSSELGYVAVGLLGLMGACLALHARGHVRAAHGVMAMVGAVLTGKLVFDLVSHYARCRVCSVAFDVSPNAASWAFLDDYLACAALLALFAVKEGGRFALSTRARALWAAGMLVAPTVAAPLFFSELHAREQRGDAGTPVPARSWRWVYLAFLILSPPFVWPSLRVDHFGALGGELYVDATTNQLNAYVARAILLLYWPVFLFTLPRTRGFWLKVAGLWLGFTWVAAYLALWASFYDGRFTKPERTRRHAFTPGGAWGMAAATLLANAIAFVFVAGLRSTPGLIKAPATVCAEGLATRSRELPVCVDDLTRAATMHDSEETRACLELARSAIAAADAGDEKLARELTRRLGGHHGSDLRSCQTASSANIAVLNECPEL